MNVRTDGRERLAVQTLLNALERLKRDQAIVIALAERHAPAFAFDISGIDAVGQDAVGLFVGDVAVTGTRELRVRFEEALHLSLGTEATAGIGFQSLGDHRGNGFVANERAAAVRMLFVAKAQRSAVDVIAPEHSRPHPFLGLQAVLLALVLREARHQILMENAVGVRAELP
nr:hypothetical protein [Caenibius tardaugens]